MSGTLPPPDPARVAASLGAQVSLDPTGTASQGARGVHRVEAENLRHLAAGYREMGLDPHDPNAGGSVPDAPAPSAPPTNIDVPYVQQAGSELTCTMGNWTGEPTSYAYAWDRGGMAVGTDSATYTVSADDIGGTLTCVVSATNALGTTAAPPSNAVVVTAPAS